MQEGTREDSHIICTSAHEMRRSEFFKGSGHGDSHFLTSFPIKVIGQGMQNDFTVNQTFRIKGRNRRGKLGDYRETV